MIILILIIIAIIILIVWLANRRKPVSSSIITPVDCCEKCGSRSYRFLWDRQLIRTEKKQVTVKSGFSDSKGSYSGRSIGYSGSAFFPKAFGSFRPHRSWHSGTSTRHTDSYRIKEVTVKIYRVSCKCNQCGHVWSKIVRDDEYNVGQSAGAIPGHSNEDIANQNEVIKLKKQIGELLNVNPSMSADELATRLETDIAVILEALAQMGRA